MTEQNLKQSIECLLFVADAPVSIDRLCTLLEEYERPDIRLALKDLVEDYSSPARGIFIAEVAEGWQFRTRPEYADILKRLTKTKGAKFSQSALETLAIVAYRQPATRAEIEYLRGVDCGGVLKTLLDKKLIRILGKKDIPGKPLIYGTSKEFLELFNLKNLASLPTLKEIRELSEVPIFEEQQELPLDESGKQLALSPVDDEEEAADDILAELGDETESD